MAKKNEKLIKRISFIISLINAIANNLGLYNIKGKNLSINKNATIKGNLQVEGNTTSNFIMKNNVAPASSSSPGVPGSIIYDTDFLYVCVANNTWKRVAISTW